MPQRRATAEQLDDDEQPVAFFDIRYGQCRWPLTDIVPISDFRFCGRECVAGLSWCEEHAELALAPAK
jgi:hypothetical protein